ncbi:hypothetical protein GCM10010505_69900 [Kitasatospora aburaviensis]
MPSPMTTLAARLPLYLHIDPTPGAGGGGSMDTVGKGFKPELPGGSVGTATTTLVNWCMGGCLAAIVAALCVCAAMDAWGSTSDRPDVSARGKAGIPKCARAAVIVGLAWPIVWLFFSMGS